ncbi:MAG: hypothetical protein ACLUIX_04390 [Oscillospiraceae bacterium]
MKDITGRGGTDEGTGHQSGATSTKVAVFEEERELLKKSIVHTAQELEGFDRVIDQADFRQRAVLEAVAEGGFRLEDFDAVCGRGGLYRPIPPAPTPSVTG